MTRLGMLRDMLRSLFRKPFTEKYPYERRVPPKRLRGEVIFHPEKCTGCGMCVKDCPGNAIELLTLDKKNKRFVLRYQADQCTFCAQCVVTCNFDCLEMSNELWELAARNKQPFTIYYGDPSDIETVLARGAGAETETVKRE